MIACLCRGVARVEMHPSLNQGAACTDASCCQLFLFCHDQYLIALSPHKNVSEGWSANHFALHQEPLGGSVSAAPQHLVDASMQHCASLQNAGWATKVTQSWSHTLQTVLKAGRPASPETRPLQTSHLKAGGEKVIIAALVSRPGRTGAAPLTSKRD